MTDFGSQLRKWYAGEVAGVAFFDVLANAAQNGGEALKWALLGRLESAMAERLSSACADASIALPTAPAESGFLDYAREIAGKPWQSTMEALLPQLEAAVAEVRDEARLAPPAHADIARDYVAHEEALAAFVSAELNGEDGSPAVESLLRAWS